MRPLLVILFLTSCSGGGSGAEDPARATQRERQARVQAAACLQPAKRRDCEEGARIDFTGRTHAIEIGKPPLLEPSGSIWCEDGVTRGSFRGFRNDSKGAVVEGIVGQAVWEALWRVVDVTDACVGAYGGPVTVTRAGKERRCASPEFDMKELVERAYSWAHRKLPRITTRPPPRREGALGEICEIDPSACPFSPPQRICPDYAYDE